MKSTEIEIYSQFKAYLQAQSTGETAKPVPQSATWEQLSARYDNFVFDGFGTLYLADEAYPFTHNLLNTLRSQGKNLRLLTNAASRTATHLSEHLRSFGVNFSPAEIINSGGLLPQFLRQWQVRQAIVVGPTSAYAFLREAGCEPVAANHRDFSHNPEGRPVVVLVSSMRPNDPQRQAAEQLLAHPRAVLLVANPDVMAPGPSGKFFVSGRLGYDWQQKFGCTTFYLGKPFTDIYQALQNSLPPGPTVVLGDTLGTDILGGAHHNFDTALLLQGNTSPETWRTNSAQLEIFPNWVLHPKDFYEI